MHECMKSRNFVHESQPLMGSPNLRGKDHFGPAFIFGCQSGIDRDNTYNAFSFGISVKESAVRVSSLFRFRSLKSKIRIITKIEEK